MIKKVLKRTLGILFCIVILVLGIIILGNCDPTLVIKYTLEIMGYCMIFATLALGAIWAFGGFESE